MKLPTENTVLATLASLGAAGYSYSAFITYPLASAIGSTSLAVLFLAFVFALAFGGPKAKTTFTVQDLDRSMTSSFEAGMSVGRLQAATQRLDETLARVSETVKDDVR